MKNLRTENTGVIEKLIQKFPPETAVRKFFKTLENKLTAPDPLFEGVYLPIIREAQACVTDPQSPFLSVVIRTQGRRSEGIREVLLCLLAQTDQDFEVLIVGHNLNPEQYSLVKGIISEQPLNLREKIIFIESKRMGRAAPLNLGWAYARGNYIVALDDDDIVFSNWVEEFHKAARTHEGLVLHAYVLTQQWEMISTLSQVMALRAISSFDNNFCCNFDLISQLNANHCPFMGLAFPAFIFHEYGFIFDEKLTTTEDWDYLMRVAFLTGVEDIPITTAIYRLWKDSDDSHSVHSNEEWEANYKNIHEKFLNAPIILSPCPYIKSNGETSDSLLLREQKLIEELQASINELTNSTCWKITYPVRKLLDLIKGK